jgi:hypothetical protein
MTSAYPTPLDALLPRARQLADELGQLPSRNKLKAELHIGGDKAARLLAALTHAATDPGQAAEPERDAEPGRRLHAVPDEPVTEQTGAVASPAENVTAGLASPTDQASAPVNPDPATPDPATSVASDAAPAGRSGWGWTRRLPRSWPLVLLALPAFVAIWSGWVGLGELTGFGPVHPLPGIASGFTLNTAITLPIGVETYAAYALRVWLAGVGSTRSRDFARVSAIGSLVLGAAGQVAYHLMTAWHVATAPWPITTAVACLPVVVLGFGAALAHLQHHTSGEAR